MKKLSLSLALAGMLAGCTVPNLVVQTPATGKKDPAAQLAKADKLNGIEFKPIDANSARLVGTNGTSTGGGTESSTPMPATAPAADSIFNKAAAMPGSAGMPGPTPAMKGGTAYSGNMNGYYGYGGYFGGFGNSNEPMALIAMTGAELPGSTGSFQEILKTSVAPVVKSWAADARLVTTNATVGGTTTTSPEMAKGGMSYPGGPGGYYGEEAGWRLTYISVSLNEVLNFSVSASKTSIIRMTYAPLNLNPELVQVDSSAAIKSLVAAIEDKSFKSEEEKTGKDYFIGLPFSAPENYFGPDNRMEVVYDVPDNVRWNINLQQILGKLVWELNYYAAHEERYYPQPIAVGGPVSNVAVADGGSSEERDADAAEDAPTTAPPTSAPPKPDVMPTPYVHYDPGFYFNNSASGTIDAATGAVIRFSRPFKNYYNVPTPYPYPEKGMPMPMPSAAIGTTTSAGAAN